MCNEPEPIGGTAIYVDIVLVLAINANSVRLPDRPNILLVVLLSFQERVHLQFLKESRRLVAGSLTGLVFSWLLFAHNLFCFLGRLHHLLYYFCLCFLGLDRGASKSVCKLGTESHHLTFEMVAYPLQGIVYKNVVGDGDEDLAKILNKILHGLVLVVPEIVLHSGKRDGILGNVEKIKDAIFAYLLDGQERTNVCGVLELADKCFQKLLLFPAV